MTPPDIAYTIKFNRTWSKLKPFNLDEPFTLLWVVKTFTDVISEPFLQYDTACESGEPFELPEGAVIFLFLRQNNMIVTTIRRYTPQKYVFYRGLEGKQVGVEVVGAKKTDVAKIPKSKRVLNIGPKKPRKKKKKRKSSGRKPKMNRTPY